MTEEEIVRCYIPDPLALAFVIKRDYFHLQMCNLHQYKPLFQFFSCDMCSIAL